MSDVIDCLVAGHICLDITPAISSSATAVGELLRPGALMQVGKATVSTGGPVSNTGLPLRRLGNRVQLAGKCGDDMFGRALVESIRREAPGAEEGMQVIRGEDTSYTVVINPPNIDRMFLHCPGANDTFGAADVDYDAAGAARLFHFGYPPLLAQTYANGGEELKQIFRRVKDAGATTSLDMVYPDPESPAGRVDWPGVLGNVLPHVDIFTPSAEELTFMLERKTFDDLSRRAGDAELLGQMDGELLCRLGQWCLNAGAGIALIKCGYLGLYLRSAGPERLERFGRAACGNLDAWTDRERFEPSYVPEQIVGATGAGDCAIAAFLTGFLHGESPEDCLRYGCAVGAQNLTAADSISGVQTWDRTREQVAADPPKRPVDIRMPEWQFVDAERHYRGPNDGA